MVQFQGVGLEREQLPDVTVPPKIDLLKQIINDVVKFVRESRCETIENEVPLFSKIFRNAFRSVFKSYLLLISTS